MLFLATPANGRSVLEDKYQQACQLTKDGQLNDARKLFHANSRNSKDVDEQIKNLLCSGDVCRQQQRTDDAERDYLKATKLTEEKYGPKSPMLLPCLGSLANVRLRQDQVQLSIETSKRQLAILESCVGPESDVLLSTLETLGRGYEYASNFKEAEAVERRMLVVRKATTQWRTHINTAYCFCNIGRYARQQGKLEEARTNLEQAVKIALVSDHGDMRQATEIKTVMAACLLQMKEEDAAQHLLNEINQWCKVDDDGRRNAMVASTLLREGLSKLSIPFYEKALELVRKNGATMNNYIVLSSGMQELAKALAKDGQLDRAEQVLLDAMKITEKHPNHNARIVLQLSSVYTDYAKKPEAAVAILQQAIENKSKGASENDSMLNKLKERLAVVSKKS